MNKLFIIIISFFLFACNDNETKTTMAATKAFEIDKTPGECPFLTKDNNGHIVLSWVRMINDSSTAFCYATSSDGKKFAEPIVIPNSNNIQPHGENLPKIIFKPSGAIIALWGTGNPNPHNKYSGLVSYTQSFDHGKTWTTPRPLVTDTAGYDQRYYDVAILPNGEAGIIWLDNRKTTAKEGSGLYFAHTNGNAGFVDEKLISQPCCQCCRTDLYKDRNGDMHVIYRGIVQDSIRDMVHIISTDDGKSFSTPVRISKDNWVITGCPHTGPAITDNNNGMHIAWFTGGLQKGCYYTNSTDNGKTFTARNKITDAGSHPQLTTLPDGKLVIVWDESITVGNFTNKRIGIEKRAADGKAETSDYITAEGSGTSYPVICPIDKNAVLVAYSVKTGKKSMINYKIINL